MSRHQMDRAPDRNALRWFSMAYIAGAFLLLAARPTITTHASFVGHRVEFGAALLAQQPGLRVTGVVTDSATGTPTLGVTIRVKDFTASPARTDADGRYSIQVPSGGTILVFSRIGMAPREVAIEGRDRVDVSLAASAVTLAAVAVLGYQTVETEKVTGAVSEVDIDRIEAQGAVENSVIKTLSGRVGGVSVTSSGNPEELGSVRIRGFSTLGNRDPLYVVDGIPTQSSAAQQLKADDIETIQVLKDAATASIYGSRASNGVIVITTKSGSRRAHSFSIGSHVTTTNYASKLSVLNAEERGRALWQAAINDGVDPSTLPIYTYDWSRDASGKAILNRVLVPRWVGDSTAGMLASNTDWFDEVTRMGVTQEHSLQAGTAGDRGSALLSLGYYDNQGIVNGTRLRRYNGRINSTYALFNNRLTVGDNLGVNYVNSRPLPSGTGGNPIDLSLLVQPILPVHTTSGGWGGPLGAGFDDRDNPVMVIDINSWNRNSSLQGLGDVFADARLTPNLQATARFGLDYQDGLNTNIARKYSAGFLNRGINSVSDYSFRSTDWTFNSTLAYKRQFFGSHNLGALGGFEAIRNSYSNVSAYHEGYAIETRAYMTQNAGTGAQRVSGDAGGFSLASFFGKVDYDFENRYLATFTLRRDGSSRFGANNRWGVFPSVTAAWRLSEESFFPRGDVVSDLKIRYGYGRTGNQSIPNNAQFALYFAGYGFDNTWGSNDGTAYAINGQNEGTLPSGFFRTQSANPNLKWEQTAESNVGVDFTLFNGSITGALDFFQRTTSNILITPPYAAVIGNGGAQTVNGATMESRGGEATLRYDHNGQKLRWGVGVTGGAFRSKITELPDAVIGSYPGNGIQTILGHSPNAMFGYVVQGIFQNAQEVAAAATQPGKNVGRLRYQDLNGDGVINNEDQTWIGLGDPKFEFGINPTATYGAFSLNMLFQGVYGRDVYNGIKSQTDFTSIFSGANFGTRVLDAWSPENPGSSIPALTLANTNDETRSSTYFVENGSYLKLREVTLGYRLPPGTLPRALRVLDGAQMFVRGGNLLTFKGNTTLPDPELPFGRYPLPRMFTFGLDLAY